MTWGRERGGTADRHHRRDPRHGRALAIAFAREYCKMLGNPDFIAPERIAEIILFCYKLPQSICIRDLVVMPTTSGY